ncbi:tetraketide alpha-pyrone reductase 1 [Phtheirospermum japonicum]|uniref:Tetraketide alpha-pyrone reductase 1 n=1 Tax=Phtheirospermum japonicum TaxID=374723 RepID=A0A830BE60_9LAMI|nr:tetraketide alpha-pyrone reductase 1 [Phtheirospermum japonicum]
MHSVGPNAIDGKLNIRLGCRRWYKSIQRGDKVALGCAGPRSLSGIRRVDVTFHILSKTIQLWYPLSKVLAEKDAWEFAEENGLDIVVVNPGTVLGPMIPPAINALMLLTLKPSSRQRQLEGTCVLSLYRNMMTLPLRIHNFTLSTGSPDDDVDGEDTETDQEDPKLEVQAVLEYRNLIAIPAGKGKKGMQEWLRVYPTMVSSLSLIKLNGAVDKRCWEEDLAWAFMDKNKRISGNSSVLGAFPSGRWDMGFPSERWDRHLLMPSKESQPLTRKLWHSCNAERSDDVSQQLPQESGYDAVVSGQKTPKGAFFKSFQLRKSGNPYRPPHLNKIVDFHPCYWGILYGHIAKCILWLSQMKRIYGLVIFFKSGALNTFSELGVESSESSPFSTVESDQRGSSDSKTGNDEPVYVSPLASEMICANDKPESRIIDDNGLTYES